MLPNISALLIDLDGVVYRGEMALPGAADALATIDALGIARVFVTNNATLTTDEFSAKLTRMGIAAKPNDIVTSSEATAAHLREIAPSDSTVLVIGEEGLRQALASRGFPIVDAQPTYVVVGLDRNLTYADLARAAIALPRGAQFIATNADRALPVEAGFWPGAGAIVSALVTTTGVQPTIVGKPQPTLLRVALNRIGASPERAAMVGDHIESDIRAGRAAGIHTIWVDPGTAPPPDDVTPDLRVADLSELAALLRARTNHRDAPDAP